MADDGDTGEGTGEDQPKDTEQSRMVPEGYVPVSVVQDLREERRDLRSQISGLESKFEGLLSSIEESSSNSSDDLSQYFEENSSEPEAKVLKNLVEKISKMESKLKDVDISMSTVQQKSDEGWLKSIVSGLQSSYEGLDVFSDDARMKKFYRYTVDNSLVTDEAFKAGFKSFFEDDIVKLRLEAEQKKHKKRQDSDIGSGGNASKNTSASLQHSDRVKRALEIMAKKAS